MEEIKRNLGKEKEIYEKLTAPFPAEAYQVDSSRGFDLSSLKAQYIVERLNEALGIGGWSLTGTYERIDTDVIYYGTMTIDIGDYKVKHEGIGHCSQKKNMGDQYKSAKTDCLSKTASHFGVGNECFKGLIDPKSIKKGKPISYEDQRPNRNEPQIEKKEEKEEEIPTFSKKKQQKQAEMKQDPVKSTDKW